MADRLTLAQRSRNMARIRGQDTNPELRLRGALHARGFRFRLHVKSLPGRPDLVFSRYQAVVFVNGCFWHRHADCKLAYTPKSNKLFWQEKFAANVLRDTRQIRALTRQGWRVTVAWECRLRSPASLTKEAIRVAAWLKR